MYVEPLIYNIYLLCHLYAREGIGMCLLSVFMWVIVLKHKVKPKYCALVYL